jgi:hypothetical protein
MSMNKLVPLSASLILSALPALAAAEPPCLGWTGPRIVSLGSIGGVNQYGCGEYRLCTGKHGEKWTETRPATGCPIGARPGAGADAGQFTGEAPKDRPPAPPVHGEDDAGLAKPADAPKKPVTEEVETQDPNKRIK